jgi:hypothetical protein
MPGVFPDYPAPVVRNSGDERELTMMRWGMPPPSRTGGPPVTNIRNTSSPHWRMIDKCYWRQRGERVQTSRKLMLSPTTISEYLLQCRTAHLSIIQARCKSSEI